MMKTKMKFWLGVQMVYANPNLFYIYTPLGEQSVDSLGTVDISVWSVYISIIISL